MSRQEQELAGAFGDWLKGVAPGLPASLTQAVQRLLAAQQDGHVCIDLAPAELADVAGWQESGWAGLAGSYRPFIMDGGRLYLARYAAYEMALAEALRLRMAEPLPAPADTTALAGIFQGSSERQRLAGFLALRSRLLVISGGPGTGKTSTVVRLLALLLAGQAEDFRIAMAAPTGKAAQRLGESVRQALDRLPVADSVKARIPVEAKTLHRLLGAEGDTGRYRHHAGHPLDCDLLVVDEASMVDLALMSRLFQALRPEARVILLGDKDQLASVEAGSVLGDICRHGGYSAELANWVASAGGGELPVAAHPAVLGDAQVFLDVSHRFSAESGIGELARCSRDGEAAAFMAAFGRFDDIRWQQDTASPAWLHRQMEAGYRDYFQTVAGAEGEAVDVLAAKAFAALLRFRVLTALRVGPTGAEALNRHFEHARLLQHGSNGLWYPGRAIMVSSNDYSLRLFNGDIGICLPTADGLRVVFEAGPGQYRALHPGRLPAHEPAWAMTVHKSQGSEFDKVLLVLPEEPAPVLNRPLVYTGITRARQHFTLWGRPDVLTAALAQLPERASGLADRLR